MFTFSARYMYFYHISNNFNILWFSLNFHVLFLLAYLTLCMYCYMGGCSSSCRESFFFLNCIFFLNLFIIQSYAIDKYASPKRPCYMYMFHINIWVCFQNVIVTSLFWLFLKKKNMVTIETELLQVGYIFVVKCSWFLMKKTIGITFCPEIYYIFQPTWPN